MRREERHHLKENPLAVWLADLQRVVAEQGRTFMLGAGLVVAVLVGVAAFFAWQQWQERQAGDLLAEAMAVLDAPIVPPPADEPPPAPSGEAGNDDDATDDDPPAETPEPASPEPFEPPPGSYPSLDSKLEAAIPKLLAVADTYPNTAQGITARYQAAAALALLGRSEEAATHYRGVMDAAGDQLYGQMARMGLAESHLSLGDYDAAIGVLEGQTSELESAVPLDAVLMRLGQAYRLAGQPDNALAAFTRVIEEFPLSVYYPDAQRELDTLGEAGIRAAGD